MRGQLEAGVKRSGTSSYSEITKEGAAQVVLVGPPNAGKSSLVRLLTHAHPQVGDYPFTTSAMIPGMVPYEDILIELVDTPPVTPDYCHGQLPGLIRAAEGMIILADLSSDSLLDELEAVLDAFASRHVSVKRKQERTSGDDVSTMVFAHKSDAPGAEPGFQLLREFAGDRFDIVRTSIKDPACASKVSSLLFEWLEIVRVYTKAPGRKAEIKKPFTVFRGDTVGDVCRLIHQDFYEKLRFAKLWRGEDNPKTVSKDEPVRDGDILELHTKD